MLSSRMQLGSRATGSFARATNQAAAAASAAHTPLACRQACRPLRHCSAAVAAAAALPCAAPPGRTLSSSLSSGSRPMTTTRQQRFQRSSSSMTRRALPLPLAMVNVDFASPSLVLGVTLIGCGVALLQVRNMQREVSRDADIVVAAMISIVGSTLIFQGWRLDPLLLLCQALTTSVAFWYGLEAFKLRAEVVQDEGQDADLPGQQLPPLQDQMPGGQRPDYNAAARSGYLPPGMDRPAAPWAPQQQQQQQQAYSSNARWGLPPGGQQSTPYDAFAGSGMPDAVAGYAGYEHEQQGGANMQQQQYGAGAGAGYGGANGLYDDAAQGMMFDQQQQQQPGQYEWYGQQQQQPSGGPGSSQFMPQQQQQQPVWYDAAGLPVMDPTMSQQQQQLPYGALPGLPDPYSMPGAAAAGALPDGSMGGQLLPPADQQQQQQQAAGRRPQSSSSGRNAYEQVDDWE